MDSEFLVKSRTVIYARTTNIKEIETKIARETDFKFKQQFLFNFQKIEVTAE